jgi:YHS domain-containing protein
MLLILRIVLILLIVRAVLMLARGIKQGMESGPHTPPPGVQLMRDPICGVYVSPSRALTARKGTGTAYFCSEKCRREWERR